MQRLVCCMYIMFSGSIVQPFESRNNFTGERCFFPRIRNLHAKCSSPQLLISHHAHACLLSRTIVFLFLWCSFIFCYRGRHAVSFASLSWLLELSGEKKKRWIIIILQPMYKSVVLFCLTSVWYLLFRCQFGAPAVLHELCLDSKSLLKSPRTLTVQLHAVIYNHYSALFFSAHQP